MKKYFIYLFLSFFIASPLLSQENPNADTSTKQMEDAPKKVKKSKKKQKAVQDGSSFKNAIVIKANNEIDGVNAEYEYLKKNFPGYKPTGQSLVQNGGKPYDVITIKNQKGEEKVIYFDISKFFGKL